MTENVEVLDNLKIFDKYTGQLLRNFTTGFLDNYLKDLKIIWETEEDYYKERREKFKDNGIVTISKILNNLCENSWDDKVFEKILFNELTSILPDRVCLYNFSTDYSIDGFLEQIDRIGLIEYVNRPIYSRVSDTDPINLVSIRKKEQSVIFLFRNGLTNNEENKNAIFFTTCEINFEYKFFNFKYRETFRKNSKKPANTLIKNSIDFMEDLLKDSIKISVDDKADVVKEKLYKLFLEETSKADKVIYDKLPLKEIDLEKKINVFLEEELNLSNDDPSIYKQNLEKVKYMYCSNIAKELNNSDFKNRHIFAYSFYDGTTTRSITRDSKRDHIYSRDLYWSLKSTVTKEAKINEISLYYKINQANYKLEPLRKNFMGLEITFKAKFGGLMIEYYTKTRDMNRSLKHGFTLYELRRYL